VREHVDKDGDYKTAKLMLVGTDHQSADIYTKALTGPKFVGHRVRNIGVKRMSSEGVMNDHLQKKRRR
jgi:hypothetical protein